MLKKVLSRKSKHLDQTTMALVSFTVACAMTTAPCGFDTEGFMDSMDKKFVKKNNYPKRGPKNIFKCINLCFQNRCFHSALKYELRRFYKVVV